MLLYFSSEKNVDIFDKQSQELGIHTDLVLERDFTGYIETNSTKLNHLEFLAIDLENIIDDEMELIKSLCAFRLCNSNVSIIIVGIGREKGDSLLGRFFAEGIYNFVTSKDEEVRNLEVKNCFEKTNNYANTLGYRVENFEVQKTKNKKGFFNNFLDNIKKSKKEKAYKKNEEHKPKKEKSIKIQQVTTKHKIGTQNEKIDTKEHLEAKKDDNNFCNLSEKQTIKTEEKSLSQVAREIKKANCGLMSTFKNIEKDIQVDEKAPIFIEVIEDTKVLNYFGNVVGIIEDTTAIIDIDFETDILKQYCNDNKLDCLFKENIYDKLAKFS